MSTLGQAVKYTRGGRRKKDVPDLNISPAFENAEQAGEPSISVSQSAQGEVPVPNGRRNQLERSTPPAPINVEDLDDDVIISSPRAFEEAKKKSRRTRRTVVVDVESEETVIRHLGNHTNKRRRGPANSPIINCDLYVNLEAERSLYVAPTPTPTPTPTPPPPPPPPPNEPTFTCPVCMGALVEEVTTKCGHIFCKACIMAAIAAQHKCPTCRQKLTNKNIIRVYLPTTK